MDDHLNLRRPAIRILACMEARSVTGPAKNLLMVAQALAAREESPCHIEVATFLRNGASNAFTRACEEAGVAVHIIRERWRFDPEVIPQLRSVIRDYQPDIIQTHNPKSHFLVRACGMHRELPWLAFNHGYTTEDLKMKLYNQVDRWSLRGAHRVVAVCRAFGAALCRWGVPAERILVRHNSVSPLPTASPEQIQQLREKLRIPAGAVVLLTVGRLSPEKGHRDLIAAIAELKQRKDAPDFRMLILGAGPELDRLQGICRALEVTDLVTFAGTTADVAPYYSLADIFILPSHSEGSPNALLEAMIGGTPVVATSVGGVPEIVESGVGGLLVPAGNIHAMAEAVAELMRNPELRRTIGARARECVSRDFSRQAYIDWMAELYEGTVGRRLPARAGTP